MTKLTPSQQLKNILDHGELPGLLVLQSSDAVRRTRAIDYLLQKLLKSYKPTVKSQAGVQTVNLSDYSSSKLSSLISEIKSPSLFCKENIWILSQVEELRAQETRVLVELIQKVPPHVKLIFSLESKITVPTFVKAIEQVGTWVIFEELKGFELQRWIEKELRFNGIEKFDEPLLGLIATLGEGNADKIASMIEQLSLYLEGNQASSQDLLFLFKHHASASDFELLDCITSGKYAKAEMLLENFFHENRSPFMLTGLVARSWGQYLTLSHLNEKRTALNEMRTKSGLAPWLFSKQLDVAKRLPSSKLAQNFSEILRADCSLKGRSGGPIVALSRLLERLS